MLSAPISRHHLLTTMRWFKGSFSMRPVMLAGKGMDLRSAWLLHLLAPTRNRASCFLTVYTGLSALHIFAAFPTRFDSLDSRAKLSFNEQLQHLWIVLTSSLWASMVNKPQSVACVTELVARDSRVLCRIFCPRFNGLRIPTIFVLPRTIQMTIGSGL